MMLSRKKILVVLSGLVVLGTTLVVLFVGSGPDDLRPGLMILAALQSAVLLGLVWVAYLVGRRAEMTAQSIQPLRSSLEVFDRNTQQKLDNLGTSLLREVDALDRASQARFRSVDQRLGRQGRRVEAIYRGVQHHLVPLDSISDEVPLLTQINATKELLDRTNTSLVSMRAEVDQGSKRLREHSGHLRRLLEEQSKISSKKALFAQAAVIEELLEGMDSIVAHNHRNEM